MQQVKAPTTGSVKQIRIVIRQSQIKYRVTEQDHPGLIALHHINALLAPSEKAPFGRKKGLDGACDTGNRNEAGYSTGRFHQLAEANPGSSVNSAPVPLNVVH